MFISVNSAAAIGLECVPIRVEVDVSGSWPGFQIVGLPDTSIQEAKERIRAAWKNAGLHFPSSSRITINLAPADVRKVGAAYDLPIAIGMFLASEKQTDVDISNYVFVGELALDGTLRHANGILPLSAFAKEHGMKIIVPHVNANEASIIAGTPVFGASHLNEVIDHVTGAKLLPPFVRVIDNSVSELPTFAIDFSDVSGQEFAKRALEVAAAGAHNVLLSGPPGSGKTLLARALPSILPRMSENETIEVTKLYSVAGQLPAATPLITTRPFRSPHHSASATALIGGGAIPRPGEISLAHRGVLFLDEFPEFPKSVIEHLRQPLEDGVVTISRARGTVRFPARFMLIASQNPCPCGHFGDTVTPCVCGPAHVALYQKKLSGPIKDRIDMLIEVPRVPFEKLSQSGSEPSSSVRARVAAARDRQRIRFAGYALEANADMQNKELRAFCALDASSQTLLQSASERLMLSARGYHRIIKLARTIADLDQKDRIEAVHIAEALQYK